MAVRVHVLTDSCISLTNSSVYHHAFDFDFDIERREENRGQHTRGEDLQKKKNRSEGEVHSHPERGGGRQLHRSGWWKYRHSRSRLFTLPHNGATLTLCWVVPHHTATMSFEAQYQTQPIITSEKKKNEVHALPLLLHFAPVTSRSEKKGRASERCKVSCTNYFHYN